MLKHHQLPMKMLKHRQLPNQFCRRGNEMSYCLKRSKKTKHLEKIAHMPPKTRQSALLMGFRSSHTLGKSFEALAPRSNMAVTIHPSLDNHSIMMSTLLVLDFKCLYLLVFFKLHI